VEDAVTWDSSITRVEIGVGYYFHRHVLAKAAYQYNERDAGPLTVRHVPAIQLLFWF
jgi:predicted porin